VTDHTLVAGAPGLPLGPGMVLKLQAIDPTTGAEVSGVKATRWTIYGYDASAVPFDDFLSVSPLLVPTNEPV
jgi:hypothetical protein